MQESCFEQKQGLLRQLGYTPNEGKGPLYLEIKEDEKTEVLDWKPTEPVVTYSTWSCAQVIEFDLKEQESIIGGFLSIAYSIKSL